MDVPGPAANWLRLARRPLRRASVPARHIGFVCTAIPHAAGPLPALSGQVLTLNRANWLCLARQAPRPQAWRHRADTARLCLLATCHFNLETPLPIGFVWRGSAPQGGRGSTELAEVRPQPKNDSRKKRRKPALSEVEWDAKKTRKGAHPVLAYFDASWGSAPNPGIFRFEPIA